MHRSSPQRRSSSRERRRNSPSDSRSSSTSQESGPRKHRSKYEPSLQPPSPGLRRVKSGRSFHREVRSTRERSRSPQHRRERRRSSDEDRPQHHRRSRSPDPRNNGRRRPREASDDEYRSDQRRRDDRPGRSHRDDRSRSRSRRRDAPRNGPLARQDDEPTPAAIEKQQPNFARSGKLAAETNTVAGTEIVLKYHEPPEARLPPSARDWRMYEFKGEETLSTTELSGRSCWLIGRETAVVDFLVQHPSCSSQHAVLQFRHVEKKNEFGERIGKVKLYVLDLESANGTKLNGDRIEARRFIEVRSNDVLRFGDSTREYVILLA